MSEPEVTAEEDRAIKALEQLAKRWPQTLTLLSDGGALSVIHSADRAAIAEGNGVEREDLVLASIDGIPNDGGGW